LLYNNGNSIKPLFQYDVVNIITPIKTYKNYTVYYNAEEMGWYAVNFDEMKGSYKLTAHLKYEFVGTTFDKEQNTN
jgi:hypothetical protein